MPIKLIGTIILLILVTIFAGVNLDNKCDITFIFYTFKDIPVFMTVIISFAIGAVFMLPFTFGRGKKRSVLKQKTKQLVKAKNSQKSLWLPSLKLFLISKSSARQAKQKAKKAKMKAEKNRFLAQERKTPRKKKLIQSQKMPLQLMPKAQAHQFNAYFTKKCAA